MPFFQPPYGGGQPDLCLGPDGQVVNVAPTPVIPLTFEFGNGGFGTPMEGQPLAQLSVTPMAIWALNIIAVQKMRGPVPAVEG